MSSHHISKITLSTFNNVLSRYVSSVPERLHSLDASRYDIIPAHVADSKGGQHLTRDQVSQLVEWKLKHGTFRPKLLQLVQSNSADAIQETTTSAFELLPDVIPALKCLVSLKGIGPATASLLLSVAAPGAVPFFSDELFRWSTWDEPGSPNGWQRKIKYNAKEYELLLKNVDVLVKRLNVQAVDAEKVAWVLGKESVDVDAEDDDAIDEAVLHAGEAEFEADVERTAPKQRFKSGTKRKASEKNPQSEGTRKSTRTKK